MSKPESAFKDALDARRGDLDPATLKGAAKQLYRDSSLSDKQLEGYVEPQQRQQAKTLIRQRPTFKRT